MPGTLPSDVTPVRAYVALGSNLGNREGHLAFARQELGSAPGVLVRAASREESTAPLGGLDQPEYLNQMVALDTTLAPAELLALCHDIERRAGRARRTRWESRTLDLDVVRYGAVVSEAPGLRLPHPGLAHRAFWRDELDELHRNGW